MRKIGALVMSAAVCGATLYGLPSTAVAITTEPTVTAGTTDSVVEAMTRTPKPTITVGRCTPRKKPARGYPLAGAGHRNTRMLDAWAYYGPRAGIANGRVTAKDRSGCVVARGRTTSTGAFGLAFRKEALPRLPLTLTVKGGKAAKKPFKGVVKARVFSLKKHDPVVQLSLATSAASRLGHTKRTYAKSHKRVMTTLGFSPTAQSWSLQYRNSHVGYRQLTRKVRRTKGGFDGLVAKLAKATNSKQRMKGLRPGSAMASGPRNLAQGAAVQAAEAADSTICDMPVPTSGTSSSDEVISDVATTGIGALLEYAGSDAAADDVTGMLLAPLGADTETTVLQADVNAVMDELSCISDQIGYLSDQIAYMQYTIDISTSEQCASDVSTYFYDYQQLMAKAEQYPINAQNTSLMDDLPQWDGLNTSCAEDVNSSLFGTPGGEASAWQQLNENYSSGIEWYTQLQVQALQANLQYWGTILYQAYVLENEYYNFYGQWENAQIISGGSNPTGDSPVCDAIDDPPVPPTYVTPNYCVYQSNVGAAFPADLYSDEIGIISTGAGINALPGGMIADSPIEENAALEIGDTNSTATQQNTPTAMTGPYWYNQYLNTVMYSPSKYSGSPTATLYANGTYSCSGGSSAGCTVSSFWDWAYEASRYFNLETDDPVGDTYEINPNGYGTAVQTFWNPQNTSRASVTWSSVSDLASDGPALTYNPKTATDPTENATTTASQNFYDMINQTPSPYPSEYAAGGAWSGFSESNAAFWTDDTTSYAKFQVEADSASGTFKINSWFGSPLGSAAGWSETSQTKLPNTPVFAFLSGRTWWSGSAGASSFVPPTPPTS